MGRYNSEGNTGQGYKSNIYSTCEHLIFPQLAGQSSAYPSSITVRHHVRMYTRLTPREAKKRFGELKGPTGAHREFEDATGLWRPEFDADVKLSAYRLFPTGSSTTPRETLFKRKRRWK